MSDDEILGTRAENRRQDFFFGRTQSRVMAELPWASRTKPISAFWSALAYWLLAGCVVCGALTWAVT